MNREKREWVKKGTVYVSGGDWYFMAVSTRDFVALTSLIAHLVRCENGRTVFEPEELFTSAIEGDDTVVTYNGDRIDATKTFGGPFSEYHSAFHIEYDGCRIRFTDDDSHLIVRTADFIAVSNVHIEDPDGEGVSCSVCIRYP